MNRRRRKNKQSNRGFTLAETLLAVLILLLVSGIVAAGIPAVKNAYEKVVLASNAEVLLSTTITTLRNELGMARGIETPDDNSVTYYHSDRGSESKIYKAAEEPGVIMFQRYQNNDYQPVQLISDKTATADLYVTYDSVEYSSGIVKFSGLSVNRRSGSTGLAVRETLLIRSFADK